MSLKTLICFLLFFSSLSFGAAHEPYTQKNFNTQKSWVKKIPTDEIEKTLDALERAQKIKFQNEVYRDATEALGWMITAPWIGSFVWTLDFFPWANTKIKNLDAKIKALLSNTKTTQNPSVHHHQCPHHHHKHYFQAKWLRSLEHTVHHMKGHIKDAALFPVHKIKKHPVSASIFVLSTASLAGATYFYLSSEEKIILSERQMNQIREALEKELEERSLYEE